MNGDTVSSTNTQTPLRLAIIEPAWTNYRYPVYRELSEHCHVDWIYSPASDGTGYGAITPSGAPSLRYLELPMRKLLGNDLGFWQVGATRYLWCERPDVVMIDSNPRSITFWATLICGRILGIPVYAHGHGVYRKTRISRSYRRMMNLLLRMSAGYIAYSPSVRDAFATHGFPVSKIRVAHNSVINACPLPPDDKTGSEKGVLFLGRLRANSGIEALLTSVRRLRQDGYDIELHVIGGGEDLCRLQEAHAKSHWVHLYGEVYSPAKIREISRACFVGCHPGPAGLSVVHLMSMSLPVMIQDTQGLHGPEASVVDDWINGVRYPVAQTGPNIEDALLKIFENRAKLREMQGSAYQTYINLTTPSLAIQLERILVESPCRPACAETRDMSLETGPCLRTPAIKEPGN